MSESELSNQDKTVNSAEADETIEIPERVKTVQTVKTPLNSKVSTGETKRERTGFYKYIDDTFETIIRHIFFWESDDVKIGEFLRFLHQSFLYSLAVLYILNHTLYPSYFLFLIIYGLLVFIWLQHLICGECLFTKLEQKLIGDKNNFFDPLLKIFHIHVTHDSGFGIVILSSTTAMLMLTMELLNRTILNIQSWISLAAIRK